jgi:multidrug efflux system outer membrane protein
MFTLFIVPVFYSLIAARHQPIRKQAGREALPGPMGGAIGLDEWQPDLRPAHGVLTLQPEFLNAYPQKAANRLLHAGDANTGGSRPLASDTRKHRGWMKRWLAAHLSLFLVLAGCTLGPDYQRPSVPAPKSWQDGQADPASLADLSWWELFEDEELRRLVQTALAANNDLKLAVNRVDQTRALLGITRADQFPRIDAGASATTNRSSENVPLQGPGGETDLLSASVDLTFEIDLWGRLRRASEAARAELLASEEARHTVMITLVSDVATTYLQLRQLDLELETTRRNVASRRDSLKIARERFEAGLTSSLDLRQAEAALASTAAQIPDLARQIGQTENRLSILLGRNPGSLPRGRPLIAQTAPPAVPAGLPSALLERRPDIREAEAGLVAANARIGVAKAAFFPQIDLTGFFGVESEELSDLFDGPSRVWQFGPGVSVPIFTAGRNQANLELAEALQRERLIRYEQAIQQAFREVEDALIAHRKAREVLTEQHAAVQASRDALSIAESRYASGLTNYLNVLDAQRTLLSEEIAESRTLLAQHVAVVQLYRALGGGWDAEQVEEISTNQLSERR